MPATTMRQEMANPLHNGRLCFGKCLMDGRDVGITYRAEGHDASWGHDISTTVHFMQGLLSRSYKALLAVVSAMTIVTVFCAKVIKDAVDVQGELGLDINEACQTQGTDMFDSALCQGAPQAIGGAATLLVGGVASRPADCGEVDAKISGLGQYRDSLTNAVPEAVVGDLQRGVHVEEEAIQNRIQEIQEGREFVAADGRAANPNEVRRCPRADGGGHLSDAEVLSMTRPEERRALRSRLDEHNTTLRNERSNVSRMHLDRANTATAVAGGFSSTIQGIGTSISSRYQQGQKDAEGQVALGQATQNISQGLAGQFHSTEDKRESEIQSALQQIGAIAHANQIGSAA